MPDDPKLVPVLPPHGGDAFPTPEFMDETMVGASRGATMRDYFAAAAAQGFVASYSGDDVLPPKPERVAEFAYQVADAMLAARKKTILVPAIVDD